VELFVRYWDNALSPAEADELAELLKTDPAARDLFQFLSTQVVAAAELPAVTLPAFDEVPVKLEVAETPEEARERGPQPRKDSHRWSRRGVLGLVGGVLAAGIGAFALARWFWNDQDGGDTPVVQPGLHSQVHIVGVKGTAAVRTADGRPLSTGMVPTGSTVSTRGLGSTATILYPDGSTVSLLNDSAITIHESGQMLLLRQGTASAELLPRTNDRRLTLTTSLLSLTRVNDTAITVGQGARSTEIEVHHGSVSVSAPTGEPMTVVRQGELLTVGANGARTQQPIPATPDEFVWNLTQPLPEGWAVGRREIVDGTPVVRCEAWPDPYYGGKVMHQIRSDHQWTRGMVRFVEGSKIHVRYRAKRSSPRGQVCFCVRTPKARCPDTGMLEYNGGFEASRPGEWRWLHILVGSMLANNHKPGFGAPWIGFLMIFNTFETDVGLEVAEFRVTPPGT
jgi:ferric-dicitrate binding protein FerR (iron transport regulator)